MTEIDPWMKICPQCAEPVRLGAKVCRYCGFSFDEAESQERRSKAPWWKKAGYLIHESLQETAEKQKYRHPVSCCGCSCGTVLAATSILVLTIVAFSSLSLLASIGVGVFGSLVAINVLNFALGGRPRWAGASPNAHN
jgi:hypothetical protein